MSPASPAGDTGPFFFFFFFFFITGGRHHAHREGRYDSRCTPGKPNRLCRRASRRRDRGTGERSGAAANARDATAKRSGAEHRAVALPARTARLTDTFVYVPVFNLFYYSVTNWDGITPNPSLVGASNYKEIFTNPEYFEVFTSACTTSSRRSCRSAMALYFATILSFKIRFRNFCKGILFFPYLINGVAIGFIFLYFFQPGGTLDSVLQALRVHTSILARRPALGNFSLAGISIWRYMGLNFVLFLGAIQSIPGDALRGRRTRRRESLAPVPLHHRARHPADHQPVLHPGDLRLPVGLRDPVHHDRRRERHRYVRDPDLSRPRSSSSRSGWPRRWPWCCLLIVLVVTWCNAGWSRDDDVELA